MLVELTQERATLAGGVNAAPTLVGQDALRWLVWMRDIGWYRCP